MGIYLHWPTLAPRPPPRGAGGGGGGGGARGGEANAGKSPPQVIRKNMGSPTEVTNFDPVVLTYGDMTYPCGATIYTIHWLSLQAMQILV